MQARYALRTTAIAEGAGMDTTTINHDGDTWRILSQGVTRDDGKTFCHLASTTRGRQQRNGLNPVQINDWVDIKPPHVCVPWRGRGGNIGACINCGVTAAAPACLLAPEKRNDE